AHFLVSAAEPLLRLLVLGPRPPELVAQALRLGEKAAQLLLRDFSLRLQRGVALLALVDLRSELLAARLHLRAGVEEPLQRPPHALAPLRDGGIAHLGLGHLGLDGLRALPRPRQIGLQRAQPRLSLTLLALAGGDGLARSLLLAGHLAHRRLEVLALVPEHLVALGDAAEVLLQPRDVALEAKVRQFLLAFLV